MNKIKKKKGVIRLWVILALLAALCSAGQAIELNVDFVVPANTIKTLGTHPDATLTTMTAGSGVVRVLKGSPLPPTALSTDDTRNPIARYSGGDITGGVGDGGLGDGSYYFAHSTVNVTSGDTFFVRAWNAAKNCYINLLPAQSISWGDSPLPNYTLNFGTANAYWAMAPMPASFTVRESMQRNDNGTPLDPADDFYDLTLTVNPSYNESTTHIQLAATSTHNKYRIHCYKAGDLTPPDLATPTTDHRVAETDSGSVSFSGGPGPYFTAGDYRIGVYTFNHFGQGGPITATWSTLSGGGPIVVTYNFQATTALGVNQFSSPFSGTTTFRGPSGTDRPVRTIQEMINAMVAEGVTVNTFGWWDPVRQVMVGWSNLAGTPVEQNSPGNLTDPLVRDQVYQMSVSANITFTLTGTR